MNCLTSIVKYILYLFNLIFVVCGILLIVLGSIMLGNIGDFSSFEDAVDTETIPIIVIVLGCVIFVISFFGCCGAIRENAFCMMTYAVFMFILFCLQIALVVWVFVKRSDFLNTMDSVVQTAWKENDDAHGYPMDALQISFKCCGLVSYHDYTNGVPNSCCGTLSTTATCPADVYQYREGCAGKFHDFWASNTNIIRYGGIGVAIVELVALTFACCVANGIRRSRRHHM